MKSDKKIELHPKDNPNAVLLRIRELVQKGQENREKQFQKVTDIFSNIDSRQLFSQTATVEKDKDNFTTPKVDFLYYKLDTNSIREQLGLRLRYLESSLFISEKCAKIKYIEYYLDSKHSCIIFVKYNFKHIRLLSDNHRTDLNTFVFVNSSSDIYYYDDFSGARFLKSFNADMTASSAKDFILSKKFNPIPVDDRIYHLISAENPESFEEKTLKEIHLFPKQLLDILLQKYKDDTVPSKSNLKVETHFIGMAEKTSNVQTKIPINYRYSGTVEITDTLLEYEIVLYFPDTPNKKVIARFYLTESEKNQVFTLPEELLKNAILEEFDENVEKYLLCDKLYSQYLGSKITHKQQVEDSAQAGIAKMILENTKIENVQIPYAPLKGLFEKIYLETFKINTDNFPNSSLLVPVECSKFILGDTENRLLQSNIYYMVYKKTLYLIEVSSNYIAYYYHDSNIAIHFPVLCLSNIQVKIFKPVNFEEVDNFINRTSVKLKSTRLIEFSSNYNFNQCFRFDSFKRSSLKEIFADFNIVTGQQNGQYKISNIDSSTIYKKLLDCIKDCRSTETSFNISYPMRWGSDDEEPKKKIPIFYDGIIYGYYFYDEDNVKEINSPFKKDVDYSYSSGDNLFRIEFNWDSPFYKTTLHTLLDLGYSYRRNCEIVTVEPHLTNNSLWKACANFILENQKDIFSE